MQIFAANEVVARSRFWYVLHQTKKMKKTTGEILSVNEIIEKNPNTVKNFAIWLRYNSRSGTHNMYKEFRDTTLCGAVEQMYADMSGRHRARKSSIQIIKTAVIKASESKRVPIQMMHDSKIKFPLTHVRPRAPHKRLASTFVASRPSTFVG
jgi:large subunit ribosomal protein L18Ae